MISVLRFAAGGAAAGGFRLTRSVAGRPGVDPAAGLGWGPVGGLPRVLRAVPGAVGRMILLVDFRGAFIKESRLSEGPCPASRSQVRAPSYSLETDPFLYTRSTAGSGCGSFLGAAFSGLAGLRQWGQS